jgi:hypothetical protein
MSDGLRIEVTIPATVDDVWPAFRDRSVVRQWFGWEYEHLDEEIRTIFVDGTVVEEEGRRLHVGGHRFELEPLGTAQTIVRVTRATPLGAEEMDWDAYYDDVDEGWLTFLEQLRFAMTHHGAERTERGIAPRHTVHLDGTAPAPTPVAAALGLDVDGPAGSPYRATVAGEELRGTIWFRSPHQLGLTVDSWGPGLLLLAEAPNSGGLAASATLTTYGPIDGDRAARWTGAWRAAYPD